MPFADLGDVTLHYREDGERNGAPIIFANALGTDLTIWDAIIPRLFPGLRIIRYDKRGHGLSDCPSAPYSMGALVRDAERLLDHLNVRDCVFVGLSIGGMIAQGLAIKRLDQVRALVLSNTAAKIGQPEMWNNRIKALQKTGLEGVADDVMKRWFSRAALKSGASDSWRQMLISQPLEGYIGCCTAIGGTDFYTPTCGLRLPTLGIAGSDDAATPPDLVRETVDLIPGSEFRLIRRAGHLPCVDQPQKYARLLNEFLEKTGHIQKT